MKNNILIILLIIIPLTGMNAQKNVVINVLDRTKGTTYLYFQDIPIIRIEGFAKFEEIGDKETTSDSTYVIIINTSSKPDVILAKLFNNMEDKTILITPGDTLDAIIDFIDNKKEKFKVIFYGKNEENYNAYYDLNKDFERKEIINKVKSVESLEKYIQIIDSVYIVNTKKINEIITESVLRNLMLNEEKAIIFQYLEYTQKISPDELTFTNILNIKNRYFPDEKIVCDNPLNMKIFNYINGMDYLSIFLRKYIKAENKLIAGTDTIEKYFAGELKEYLLAMNFGASIYIYKRNKELNGTEVDKWYKNYSEKIKGDIYRKYLFYSYERYKILNNPFPEYVLKEKIIQLSDSMVFTMKDFIEKHKGMQLIVDNWATWCGPCIREMNVGKQNVKKLMELGNTFIYISIDEISDFKKAKEKAIELGIIENAYIIPGGYKSDYAKFLNMNEIPRYIMIDIEGKVKSLRMNYPSTISDFSVYRK